MYKQPGIALQGRTFICFLVPDICWQHVPAGSINSEQIEPLKFGNPFFLIPCLELYQGAIKVLIPVDPVSFPFFPPDGISQDNAVSGTKEDPLCLENLMLL